MAKVVNQNDIVEIVKSAESLNSLIVTISEVCKTVKKNLTDKDRLRIKLLKCILSDICDILSTLSIQTFYNKEKIILNNISTMRNCLNSFLSLISVIKLIKFVPGEDIAKILAGMSKIISVIIKSITDMSNMLENLNKISLLKMMDLFFSFLLLSSVILSILISVAKCVPLLVFLTIWYPIIKMGFVLLANLIPYITLMVNRIAEMTSSILKNILLLAFEDYALKKIRQLIAYVLKVYRSLLALLRITDLSYVVVYIYGISFVIKHLKLINDALSEVKSGFFFRRKMKNIIKTINLLHDILKSLNRIRLRKNLMLKIFLFNLIFSQLATLFSIIVILSPIALVAVPAMLIIIGSLYLMYLGIKLISLIARSILKGKTILGLLALLIVFSILSVIAAMMGIIALISIVVAENAMNILILIGIIAAVVLSVGIFAFVLGLIIVPLLIPITIGLVSMVFIVGMITMIAIMLLLLSKIELDPDKIKKNVKSVISTALMVVDCIFGGEDRDSEESNKSWIVSVIEKFASGLVYIIKAIMAVAFLATIIVAILLITLIATQLRLLQELDLDPDKIKTNVRVVIDTAMMITDILFGPDNAESEESNKSWIVSVIETFASGLVSIIKAIMAISFLATTLLCITLIMIIAKQLEHIQKLQLDPDKIRTNIQNIFDICNMIKNQLFSNPTENKGSEDSSIGSIIGKFFKPMADIANALSMFKFLAISLIAIGGFATLAKHLQTINEFKGVQNADQKVAAIKSLCSQIIQGISEKPKGYRYRDAEDKIDLISDLLEAIYDYGRMSAKEVENTTKITDSYIKFFDKINTVDLAKLQTTVTLFEKMAEFSESINGNFEGLAEALNEKIAPLLEELNKGMEGLGKKVEKSGADMSASISANSSNTNMSPATMSEQVKRENPNLSQSDVQKLVDQRMGEQSRQQSEGLEAKLEELLELFRTGQARVVLR